LAAQNRPENIIIFHRMLFAMPMGLALVALATLWRRPEIGYQRPETENSPYPLTATHCSLLCAGLAGAVLCVPNSPSYNRLWHRLQVTPADLRLKHYVSAWTPPNPIFAADDLTFTITHPLGAKLQEAFLRNPAWP